MKVAFLHLDLGIGGAESLIVSMASSLISSKNGTTPNVPPPSHITIYTTRCDEHHCFSQVKKGGILDGCVKIRASYIPPSILGLGTVLFSNLRVLLLGLYLAFEIWITGKKYDVVVVDVLPSALPFLKFLIPDLPLCFYCHFPDKYLVRNTVNGKQISRPSLIRRMYRYPMDWFEEFSMSHADVVGVNSNFTKGVFREAFPALAKIPAVVLYPAINLEDFIPPAKEGKKGGKGKVKLLSMNRFERKKNVGLAIEMMGKLKEKMREKDFERVELVVAGGYDDKNRENVEHMEELKTLASSNSVSSQVNFMPSVSDSTRARLLQTSLCVLYTPDREHFGIVPLEAMYAGAPVVAVASGGPLETVKDGETGYLVEGTPEGFAEKVGELLRDEGLAEGMGKEGHKHVKGNFGLDTFKVSFEKLLRKTIDRSKMPKEMGAFEHLVFFLLVISFVYTIANFNVWLVDFLRSRGVKPWRLDELIPNGF